MVEILTIQTPSLGDRSYLVTDGAVALVVDPQRDIDRVLALAAEPRGRGHPRVRDPHPQRLRLRRPGPGPGDRRGLPRERRRRGGVRPGRDRRRRRGGGRGRDAGAGDRHAGAHLHPPVLRAGGRRDRRGGRGVHRRLAAARVDRAPGPARRRARARPGRGAARLGSAAGRALPDQADGLPTHGFGSFCAATAVRGRRPPRSARRRRVNPALTLDEDRYVTGTAGRPGRLSRRTTRRWARPTRPGPDAPDLSRRPPCDAAQIAAAHRRRGVGRGPARPAGVRGRARPRVAQLRATATPSRPTSAGCCPRAPR